MNWHIIYLKFIMTRVQDKRIEKLRKVIRRREMSELGRRSKDKSGI